MPDKPSIKVITFDARATIDRAEQIQTELMDALEASDRVLVNLSHVETIDLTAIHLLYAAGREAKLRNKEVHFTGAVPQALKTALENGGFCKHAPDDARDLGTELLDFDRLPAGGAEGGHRG